MIRLIRESKLAPSDVIEWSIAFFGPGGWAGLEVTDRADCCARFKGGGGHVFVEATRQAQRRGSEVRVESLQWDHMTKVFLERL